MQESWEGQAPAKINLFLRVFERLPDGYHRIQTAMVKLALADDVRITKNSDSEIHVRVPQFPDLENETNLACKAAKSYLDAIQDKTGLRIEITKRIPIAGGLGGGSSDAAAVLRGLNQMFRAVKTDRLHQIAAKLGADVPFLLHDAAWALATGIGDDLQAWESLPPRPILLVNPGFPVSTKEVYEGSKRTEDWKPNRNSPKPRRPANWKEVLSLIGLGNDLQDVAEKIHPEIAEIRSQLRQLGAEISQMSGSGGTLFGIFTNETDAVRARGKLAKRWKSWATTTL